MKVLYIAELSSSHAANWIKLASENGIKPVLFQATAADTAMCEEFGFYSGDIYLPKYTSGPAVVTGRYVQHPLYSDSTDWQQAVGGQGIYQEAYSDFLLRVIKSEKPNVIHVLGLCVRFNNSTRVLTAARKKTRRPFPKVIYSSWGADLDYFPKLKPDEVVHIRKFLQVADFHVSECRRDSRLAREFGFRGKMLGILPANGGFDVSKYGELVIQNAPRQLITIKGRDVSDGDPIGRAMQILDAIYECRDILQGYKVQILQASSGKNIIRRAAEIKRETGLDIEVASRLSEHDLFSCLAGSRIFIANTINDGLPLSLVEALAMGAYPIHSDLESLHDYVSHRENGSLVKWSDSHKIATEIRWILENPDKFLAAQELNRKLVEHRLDRRVVAPMLSRVYRRAWRRSLKIRGYRFAAKIAGGLLKRIKSVSGQG